MAMHQTIVHGRIGKEIELKYGSNGTPIAKFSIAVSEKYNGEEKTTWYNCVGFKTTAENLAKFFGKGSEIIVIGNMSFGSYEKDGNRFNTAELIIRTFDFCGKKAENQGVQQSGFQQQNQAPVNNGFPSNNNGFQPGQQQQNGFQSNNGQANQGFQAPQDDDIPF